MKYYLNRRRRKTGTRIVHRSTCRYTRQINSREYLGAYSDDIEALADAKTLDGQYQLCKECCID